MLTKKYYEMIASAIAAEHAQRKHWGEHVHNEAIESIALNLASAFAADNPKFDRARFLKACGVAS